MKRPAHMTLVDADRYSALVTRCTEQRERAEKAEARLAALERLLSEVDAAYHNGLAALAAAKEKPCPSE